MSSPDPARRKRRQPRRARGPGRLWKRKQRNGYVWVADWHDANGKRCRRALSTDRAVAQRMFAAIIRDRDLCAAGLAIEEGLDKPIHDIVDEFTAELRARRTPEYAADCEAILERLVREMRVRTVRDIQPQAFLAYRRERLKAKLANRTLNKELTVLRTMLNWAVRARYIGYNALQGVQQLASGPGYEKRPRRALTDAEIDRFIAAAEQLDRERTSRALAERSIAARPSDGAFAQRKRVTRIPQAPLWLALVETGARFGELVKATWGDFSESQATLTFRASTTKSRKERRVPIRKPLVDALRRLLAVQHEVRGRAPTAGDYIFLTPKGTTWVGKRRAALRQLDQILDRAGIARVDDRGEKVDVHALRHSFASRLARSGVGLAQAQKLLGHSDPKLTAAIYTHLDAEDLREAVERLPVVGA